MLKVIRRLINFLPELMVAIGYIALGLSLPLLIMLLLLIL